MCLKSFLSYSDLTHLLLYTNTIEDAELAEIYINQIIASNILSISRDNIYNKAIHSKNCDNLNDQVYEFTNKPYGIISCVYIFGEGFDLPALNGVCIVGHMSSVIRIVQYLMRANRLDKNKAFKKAYYIIPYIDGEEYPNSYEKVRSIIMQMRTVDENIEQKIVVASMNKKKKKEKKKDKKNNSINLYNYTEDYKELDKIKLRLRYSKALLSQEKEEQDEYNYIKSINASLNIRSRIEYNESKSRHENYIDNPEEYFKLKGVWDNWYDFMGVDTSIFLKDKFEWKIFCNNNNINSLTDYADKCDMYDCLPRDPADFYKDFSNIVNELGLNRKRR
jgi:superfamily II DNA or RNA helicase